MKWLALVLIALLIVVSGCVQEEIVCNKPYIRVGTGCCLDENDNAICDKDEKITTTTTITAPTTTTTSTTQTTTTLRVSNIMVFQKIDIIDPLSKAIVVENIGTYDIDSSELLLYIDEILQNCNWNATSVAPGGNITADCSCISGQTIKVRAPGNSDLEFCYTE